MAYIFGSIWDRFNRNALNNLSKSVEQQGKSIQDLVAEGQLTPEQYADLLKSIHSMIGKGEITLDDLDKSSVQFDGTWFSSQFLADLNNGVINTTNVLDGSLTVNKYADNSVSLPKIYNPFGILPKSTTFTMESTDASRLISEDVFLNSGDKIIISAPGLSMSIYLEYENGGTIIPSHVNGWVTEFEAVESRNHVIRARRDNNADIRNETDYFASRIYIINDEVALKKKEVPEAFAEEFTALQAAPQLNLVSGNIYGGDGSFSSVQSNVVSVVHMQLKSGESIQLKDTNNYQMALWTEGRSTFIDGWNSTSYTAQSDTLISFMVRRVNNARLEIEDAREVIEYNSGNEFARKKDLFSMSGGGTNANSMMFPSRLVWGHEYLYSWYDKLRQNQAVKMTWAGDSTTNNSDMPEEFRRHSLGKKLMTLGGYDEALVTTINAGHGSQHTGNWLGGDKDEDKRSPNGFLDQDMQGNPDLYVFAYGFNDGSNSHFPALSWQERIDRFEENLIEGLERIRGTQYNKSADDMAIILCTPIAAYDSVRGNTPPVWNDKLRPIIQKACRDYNCAFIDITARQYDHEFSSSWSTNGDMVHPTATTNVDYMSMFDDLIMPRLFHK